MSTRTTFSLKREVILQDGKHTLRQKGESAPEGRQWARRGRAGPEELGRPGRLRSPHTARVGGQGRCQHRVGMVSGTAIAYVHLSHFSSPPVDKVHLGFLSFTARLVFQPGLRDPPRSVPAESLLQAVHSVSQVSVLDACS